MRRLQRCCCCASTRTGSLIIAVLGILLSIATIVFIWVVPKHIVSFNFFSDDFSRKLAALDIPRILLTINLCFTILISLLMYVAVIKRRSWMMLPWVVLGIVLAIGLLISVLHTSIMFFLNKAPPRLTENGERDPNEVDNANDDHILVGAIILVGGLIYLCIYLYVWAVVFSHYLDVRDEEERGRYTKAPYRR